MLPKMHEHEKWTCPEKYYSYSPGLMYLFLFPYYAIENKMKYALNGKKICGFNIVILLTGIMGKFYNAIYIDSKVYGVTSAIVFEL